MPGRALAIFLLFLLCGCDRLLPFGATLDRSSLTDRSSVADGAISTDRHADLDPSRLERGLLDGAPSNGDRAGTLDGAPGPIFEVASFTGPGDHTVSFAKSDLQIVLAGWKSAGPIPKVSVSGFNANAQAGAACGAGIWWAQGAGSATVNFDVSVEAVIFTIALQGVKGLPQAPDYWKNSGSDGVPSSKLFTAPCRALVDVVAFSDPVSIVAAGTGQAALGTSPGPVSVAASYSLETLPSTQTTWTLDQPRAWYLAAMCFK